MAILILKTNLSSRRKVKELSPVFNRHAAIQRWSVDTEDRHNVMRIEAVEPFCLNDAIELIESGGFSGGDLDC